MGTSSRGHSSQQASFCWLPRASEQALSALVPAGKHSSMTLGSTNNSFYKHLAPQRKLFGNSLFPPASFTWITNIISYSSYSHFLFEFSETSRTPWKYILLPQILQSWPQNFPSWARWPFASHYWGVFKSFLWFLIFPCHLQFHFAYHNPSGAGQFFFSPHCTFFAAISFSSN